MIRPEGNYQIVSPSGKVVYESKLYPALILGNSSRTIQGSEPNTLYSIQNTAYSPAPLTWSPSWSDIGPHRLSLTITTLGGSKITQVEKVVWLLPLTGIIIALTLILTIISILSILKKYYKK